MSSSQPVVDKSILRQFHHDGFAVVPQLFSRAQAERLRDVFMEMNASGPVEGLSEIRRGKVDGTVGAYSPDDPLAFYPRMMHPHAHPDKPVGPISMDTMLDPRIESHLRAFMGEEPYAVQSMFYFKPPGSRGQDFHQDNFYLRVKPGTCMAAWLALDDCDEDNGGMMCVPRTQDYALQCPEKSDARLYFTTEHVAIPAGKIAVLPKMHPGDVLFFNGNVIHGSGPNHSKTRFRRSFICHYVPKSTTEMSNWYTAIFSFDRQSRQIAHNTDGGPCGTLHEAPAPH